jgi:hypothetical protein
MLTVLSSIASRSERSARKWTNIRLGAHCTERPEVNQDKPNSKACLRKIPRPSTSTVRTANALGTRRRLRRRSGISPLYDVKNAAVGYRRRKSCSFAWTQSWWSQPGSNRRPQACKASALPTELWPRSGKRNGPKSENSRPATSMWWAWEDLNFRPHAYQARALTN